MRVLVTGSAGHLGEALMRMAPGAELAAVGMDIKPSDVTTHVGSISDRGAVRRAMAGAEAVLHTATLHKPHVATHSAEDFVETNVLGTLILLEEAVAAGVRAFVFTSTTSAFGDAMRPPQDAPAAWVSEDIVPLPRNIYGTTKTAAEDLAHLAHRRDGLPVIILRTSRFFPEEDDDRNRRAAFTDANLKANEFLYRRADIEDVATAHFLALAEAPKIGFERLIISAPPPFLPADTVALRGDLPIVLARYHPHYAEIYARLGWRMLQGIDRVYDSSRAVRVLGWQPRFDFAAILAQLAAGEAPGSALARQIGKKGYHDQVFADGPYPVA
ncbi:MAG: NAD(P)-dependent oxidoreductase [Pseudomonadota bacterium]